MNPSPQDRTGQIHPVWRYAGLLAFVPHLLAVLYASRQRPGFDHVVQYLSELGERGAASAGIANYLGVLPTGLLFMAFGIGLAWHHRADRPLVAAGAMIAIHGLCRAVAAIFVCDVGCRPSDPTASQIIHNAAAALGFVALTSALFTAAAWLLVRRRGRFVVLGSYALGIVAVVSQGLLLSDHHGPTGLYQRLALGALQLWVALLALHRLTRRRQDAADAGNRRSVRQGSRRGHGGP